MYCGFICGLQFNAKVTNPNLLMFLDILFIARRCRFHWRRKLKKPIQWRTLHRIYNETLSVLRETSGKSHRRIHRRVIIVFLKVNLSNDRFNTFDCVSTSRSVLTSWRQTERQATRERYQHMTSTGALNSKPSLVLSSPRTAKGGAGWSSW